MWKPKVNAIQSEIERILSYMEYKLPSDPDYQIMADNLCRLAEARATSSKSEIDKSVIIAGAINLAGIFAILSYENVHVLTSKALSFIVKTRI